MTRWYERYFTADYWAYADHEYTADRTAAEVDYLAEMLHQHAPGRRILDLGCGVGRHAVGLARRGFAVVGIDVSEFALSRAAAAAADAGVSIDLRHADLLGTWDVPTVDAAICVQAFGWGSDDDQLRMLRSVRRVLADGGILILDHSNILAIAGRYAPESRAKIGGATFHFLRRYDPVSGRSGGEVRLRRADGSTAVLLDDVRLYQSAEIERLLTRAGFEAVAVHSDFTVDAPVTLDRRYVQFVARPVTAVRSALAGHQGVPGGLDLRWAPDEAAFVAPALDLAWAEIDASVQMARRYDLSDPFAADRLGAVLGVPSDRVSAGAGVTGLLHDLARLGDGGTVLLDRSGHPHLAVSAAASFDRVAFAAMDSVVEVLAAVARHRPAVTVLDRPALRGPTWSAGDVRAIATAVRATGGVLLIDESCVSYLKPGASLAALTDDVPGLVVLRGLAKGFCCGGLRVGFAVSAPDIAPRVRSVLAPLACAALALDMAIALLRQPDPLAALRERIAVAKPAAAARLAGAGLPTLDTDPAVPWFVLPADDTTRAALARAGLAAKESPVHAPDGQLLRLSVPLSDARMAAFAAALSGLDP